MSKIFEVHLLRSCQIEITLTDKYSIDKKRLEYKLKIRMNSIMILCTFLIIAFEDIVHDSLPNNGI